MSASPRQDTPVAPELAPFEPARVPAQDLSAIATGPYDPTGQPRLSGDGFLLGLDGWNTWPWAEARVLVAEAERLGFGLVTAASTLGEHAIDAFAASNAIATQTGSVLVAASTSLRAHLHPLHVARFTANLDHVSGGRGALVFHAGEDAANAARHGLEPATQPDAEADEFVTLLKHGWAWSTPFDFAGRFYGSRRAWLCGPRPSRLPRPFLGLRGGSGCGDLAARSFDWWIFDGTPNAETALAARDRAAIGYGRALDVFATLTVTATPADAIADQIEGLTESRAFSGVLLHFEAGVPGLRDFAARSLPRLRANALRWHTKPMRGP